eukprot:361044-Chlamydomonas_euryale.AAC.4
MPLALARTDNTNTRSWLPKPHQHRNFAPKTTSGGVKGVRCLSCNTVGSVWPSFKLAWGTTLTNHFTASEIRLMRMRVATAFVLPSRQGPCSSRRPPGHLHVATAMWGVEYPHNLLQSDGAGGCHVFTFWRDQVWGGTLQHLLARRLENSTAPPAHKHRCLQCLDRVYGCHGGRSLLSTSRCLVALAPAGRYSVSADRLWSLVRVTSWLGRSLQTDRVRGDQSCSRYYAHTRARSERTG